MSSQQPSQSLVAALARNRGELDAARLAAVLERLAAVTAVRAGSPADR